MDKYSKTVRSKMMSSVGSKDTKIEIIVRKELHSRGFRFRKNDKRYPGKPDVVLPKYNTIIFIHGCFWHGHNCWNDRKSKSNTEYWNKKIKQNKARDISNKSKLEEMSWKVLEVWECELIKDFERTIDRIIKYILS